MTPTTHQNLLLLAQGELSNAGATEPLLSLVPSLFWLTYTDQADTTKVDSTLADQQSFMTLLDAFSQTIKDPLQAQHLQKALHHLSAAATLHKEELAQQHHQTRLNAKHAQSYLKQSF